MKNKYVLITGILLLLSVAGNAYFYFQYRNAQNDNPNIQTERIVENLKQITNVPDETPSVLTVVDKSKLADSQIAQNAENGDKIVIFQKAGQVYIYRPSSNKLINILSLSANASNENGTSNEANSQTQPPAENTESQ